MTEPRKPSDSGPPDLIGYLLDALEPAERDRLEARLLREPTLLAQLEECRRQLAPLARDAMEIEPPSGLAERTCADIHELSRPGVAANRRAALTAARVRGMRLSGEVPWLRESPMIGGRSWRLSDMIVALAVCVFGVALIAPLLQSNITTARVTACANKLHELGVALTEFSEHHAGRLPMAAEKGKLAAAGVCAPLLLDAGYLRESSAFVCPASELASNRNFRVPTIGELESADGPRLAQLWHEMGGSFGYVLGYRTDGVYRTPCNLRRPQFAVASDVPAGPGRPANHGSAGRNALLEDGRVIFLLGNACNINGSDDNIFVNDLGQIAAGCSVNDAVVCSSETTP